MEGLNIALAYSFFDSFILLDKTSQKRVKESIRKLADPHQTNGLSIHDLDKTRCDKTFRSARVNADLRLIFSQRENGALILLHAGHHDDAYQWAEGRFLTATPYGALYMAKEMPSMERNELPPDPIGQLIQGGTRETPLLQERGVSKDNLLQLGIAEHVADSLISVCDEDVLLQEVDGLPEELQECILDLVAGNKDFKQVYDELFVDKKDSSVLTNENSKRRFYLCEGAEELERLLEQEPERWALYLHPVQEGLVRRKYRGPVLIEGGPGTGKSVVGIHRAVHLAKTVFPTGNVLFSTYSVKLAKYMENRIRILGKLLNVDVSRIHVNGVDKLLRDIASEKKLREANVKIDELNKLIRQIHKQIAIDRPFEFYELEYSDVIQRLKIRSLDEYLKVSRIGMGNQLSITERKLVWSFFELLQNEKEKNNIWDFDDLAWAVKGAVSQGNIVPMYDSMIIDEAQDLSVPKLAALISLVRQNHDNVMILSDRNQRIFRLNTWNGDLGINVVGRANYLSLNYRTTREIRQYADTQFIQSVIDTTCLKEYKSLFSGPQPTVELFTNQEAQLLYITQTIRNLLERGYSCCDICIISRRNYHDNIISSLERQGLPFTKLEGSVFPERTAGICISSLEGCKGLEFRAIICCNFQDVASKPIFSDKAQEDWHNRMKIKRLECAKYVACTRAREELFICVIDEKGNA